MRLLQIIADGRPGGGTTQVLSLLEDLQRLNQEVLFVCHNDSYAVEQADRMGIATFGIDFFRSRMDLSVTLKLRQLVRSFDPDLIHVHGARAGFLAGMMWSDGKRPPAIYTVHGYHFLNKPWGIRHLGALAERRASHWADMTVFVCQYDRRLATKWHILPEAGKGAMVYNGIRPDDIPNKLPTNPKCIGFFGRLTYQKDPLLFLEMAAILSAEGYTAKIVGGGDMEQDVRIAIEKLGLTDHVTLCGSLPRQEALAKIADCAVVVFPSRWEGLPLAPLELMYMGIPIVAAHVSGTPEILEDGVSGILVQDRDPSQYAAAVRKITEAPEYRDRLVKKARDVVAENFTQQRVTEQYMRLYDTLLSRLKR